VITHDYVSRKLSVRDETKPLILIAPIVVGFLLNRLLGAGAVALIDGFFLIFAVMLMVEIILIRGRVVTFLL
jgi:hypothetical protein